MIDRTELKKIARKLYDLLERKQKRNFIIILLAMAASACLSQVTPKAIGWLTDDILVQTQIQFTKIIPILLLILVVNVVNEWIKILRRIMVEDTATATEKKARGIVITSLLKAPLAFYAEIENDFSYAEIEPRAEPRETLPGILEIQNLWFSYDDHKPILKGISLSIEKGMFLGVAGPSGCGKSSLIKAICKLENCGGDIFIDGTSIRSLSRHDLSQAVALVPQNPFLIAGTIYENICYGLDETPTQQEIEDAIQKSCLDEFINSLPDKIHTVLSEKGENLSGGQRQRISIARIFLRKPKILILDEATSALDNTTERFIQNAIEALQKERQMTVISIAHRLTTLKNSDRIIVMNEGEIVQTGTYQELIASEGIFQDMYYGRLK